MGWAGAIIAIATVAVILLKRYWDKQAGVKRRRQRGSKQAEEGLKEKDIGEWTRGMDDMRQ